MHCLTDHFVTFPTWNCPQMIFPKIAVETFFNVCAASLCVLAFRKCKDCSVLFPASERLVGRSRWSTKEKLECTQLRNNAPKPITCGSDFHSFVDEKEGIRHCSADITTIMLSIYQQAKTQVRQTNLELQLHNWTDSVPFKRSTCKIFASINHSGLLSVQFS